MQLLNDKIYGNIMSKDQNLFEPLAITMWDFSWLERRWPGAGYENWDLALNELLERGYNAIRIDAFPHLLAEDSGKEWCLKPVWRVQDWGSPALNKIRIQPYLNEFLAKCKEHNIKIGLSSWFREDTENTRMQITSPQIMAEIWIKTLESIKSDGLLETIFYVDLCNEWPGEYWAPFFKNDPPELTWGGWHTDRSIDWMKSSVELVRSEFPDLPLGYSIEMHKSPKGSEVDLSFFDYQEPHIWMANSNDGEFYNRVGYNYDTQKNDSYDKLQLNGKKIYMQNIDHWNDILIKTIDLYSDFSGRTNTPLITTECWGLVDYKDWPLLEWDWIKELCRLGTKRAADSGQWAAIATSNFCGPQFKGMWNDIDWHLEMTEYIKNSKVNGNLLETKLLRRIKEN
jgi:hypothetical protein